MSGVFEIQRVRFFVLFLTMSHNDFQRPAAELLFDELDLIAKETVLSLSHAKENIENMCVFRKVEILIYMCVLSKHICTKLLGFPIFKIVGKNGPASPRTPR